MWQNLGSEAYDGSHDRVEQVRLLQVRRGGEECDGMFYCRGYAFITFTNREEALEAVKQVNLVPGVRIGDCYHD